MNETWATGRAGLRAAVVRQRVAMRQSALVPRWSIVALGIGTVLLGIVVLAQPGATLTVMAALAGIWAVIAGAIRVFGAFVTGATRPVLSAAAGGVLVVVGVAGLRDLGTAVTLLAVVVAVAWLVSGIGEAIAAVNASGATRGLLAGAAAVSIVAGLGFLFVPRLALFVLVATTGIGFVLSGAIQVAVGIGFRDDEDP